MIRRRRLTVAAVVLVASAGWMPSHAAAVEAGPPEWLRVDHVPLLQLDQLIPGSSGSAEFTVTNDTSAAALFSLRVVDLRNDDNGCNHPETAAGDSTCGRGDGELQEVLELTVARSDATMVRRDVVADWETPVEDETVLGSGESRTYEMAYELPWEATDIVQTDRLSFSLEFRLEQAPGTQVAGVTVDRSGRIAATPALPRTGAGLMGLIRVGGGAIMLGGILLTGVAVGRRKLRST